MTPHDHDDCSAPGSGPRVDVRVVLFTVWDGMLWVALPRDELQLHLPAGVPLPDETLDSSATRLLTEMGVAERYLEQLYSIAQHEAQDWTVTVAYLGLALAADDGPPVSETAWYAATDLPVMNSLDRRIVEYALVRLRAKLGYTTIAFHLLPRSFSLSALQLVYESVLDRSLDKRNFRRRMQSEGILEATGETQREGSHRPARLFQFRAAHDAERYLTPSWAGAIDEETRTT